MKKLKYTPEEQEILNQTPEGTDEMALIQAEILGLIPYRDRTVEPDPSIPDLTLEELIEEWRQRGIENMCQSF